MTDKLLREVISCWPDSMPDEYGGQFQQSAHNTVLPTSAINLGSTIFVISFNSSAYSQVIYLNTRGFKIISSSMFILNCNNCCTSMQELWYNYKYTGMIWCNVRWLTLHICPRVLSASRCPQIFDPLHSQQQFHSKRTNLAVIVPFTIMRGQFWYIGMIDGYFIEYYLYMSHYKLWKNQLWKLYV